MQNIISLNPDHWPIYLCSFIMVANMVYTRYKQWQIAQYKTKLQTWVAAVSVTFATLHVYGQWKRMDAKICELTGELFGMKINQPTWEAINNAMDERFNIENSFRRGYFKSALNRYTDEPIDPTNCYTREDIQTACDNMRQMPDDNVEDDCVCESNDILEEYKRELLETSERIPYHGIGESLKTTIRHPLEVESASASFSTDAGKTAPATDQETTKPVEQDAETVNSETPRRFGYFTQ